MFHGAMAMAALISRVHAADDAGLLGSWGFESTLSPAAVAPAVTSAAAGETNLPTAAAYSTDHHYGLGCREYTGASLGSSSTPSAGSCISFSVSAAQNASATVESVTWWMKARSFATGTSGTHNTAKARLYWSVDNYASPVSAQFNPVTDIQLTDGSWVGSWVEGSSTFSAITLGAGQSVTFRLVLWDGVTDTNRRLRLDDIRINGGATSDAATTFDALRVKWRDYLTGGPSLDPADPVVAGKLASINNAAVSWQSSLNKNADRTYLWADEASTTVSAEFNECYNRIAAMALAWATPGCALYQDSTLRDDILGGLDWMHANRYFAGRTTYDNWWHWQIGSPQKLGDILILMHEALGTDRLAENLGTLDFFVPGSGGWMTGANRSDKCLAAAVHGILSQNPARMAQARDQLTSVFPYVTSGDGFHTDGSFIQHTAIAYSGSYGAELIKGVAKLYAMLQGSPWQLTDPQHLNLFSWIWNGYAPLYFRGAMPDHVRGRAISRSGSTDHGIGHYIMRSILMIADAAPPDRGEPIRAWLKQQALSDTSRSFETGSPLTDLAAVRRLMADDSLALSAPSPAHLRFPEMDRVVHRRPAYAFGLSMSSSRVYNYESINSENLRGWFTGDGMLTLHNSDLSQFERDFWATVDPYHLPGVTNPTATRTDASGQSKATSQDWVGGAGLGESGAAGMRLQTWTGDLTARKSWFFFDNEVVCLGADITGTSTSPVHTTVENRRLSDIPTETFTINGQSLPTTPGWDQTVPDASWCALQGTGGVYFPTPVALRVKREARTGSWYDVNRGYSNTTITRSYQTAWIDHGAEPSGAGYAYVLLPDADAAATSAYAASPGVEILSNNSGMQAARDVSTGTTAANFWGSSGGSTGDITCNGPASVVMRRIGNSMQVSVSDPTCKRTSPLLVTIQGAAALCVSSDPAITVLSTSPSIQLSIAVSGARGRSLTAAFSDLAPKDDFVSISPDSSVLLDVLANDSSLSGSFFHLASVGSPSHGQASVRGGAVFYQPDPGFTGTDSLVYQIESAGDHVAATATIEVSPSPGPAVPAAVAASADDGNVPANVIDGSLATRWSALGDGQWIQFDFGARRVLEAVSLAFYQGASRISTFDVLVSDDGAVWSTELAGVVSSGTTTALERFDFTAPVYRRHLRIAGHGNSTSLWNSITEAVFHTRRNLPPLAPSLSLVTPETVSVTADPLATATDPDSLTGPLRLIHSGLAVHGSASIADEKLLYLPTAGFVATEPLLYQLSDGQLVSEGAWNITISRPTTFEGFRNAHFTAGELADSSISGPTADPDGDGSANAIEFLTGSGPRTPAAFVMALAAGEGDGWIFNVPLRDQADGSPAEFSADPSPAAIIGGLVCRVEAGVGLQSWGGVGVSHVAPSPGLPAPPVGCSWHGFRFASERAAFIRIAAEVKQP